MIITFDISQIPYNTGVSRYTKQLIKNLLRIDKINHYKLFAGSLRQKRQIELFIESLRDEGLEFDFIYKIFPPSFAQKIWNKYHIFPIENFIDKTDILHCSDYTQPPVKNAKKIATIHDLTPLLFPDYHEDFIVSNFAKNLKLIGAECEHIICVSNSTAKDLLKFSSIQKSQTSVIYEAVDENFYPRDKSQIDKIKKKFNIKGKYILSVGTQEPRKNINCLIKAFHNLNLDNYQLVLTGKKGWGNLDYLDNNKNIIFTDFVDDTDLPALYSGAECFAYPSFYEGFGLPILEAASCGAPILTSNTSSMPEVIGDAGILINPNNQKEVEKGISRIVKDNKLKKSLSAKSLKQARKFSWKKTAQQTLKIYQSINKN